MNWQYKLLTIATLIVAFSCKKKNKDLIELQPNNEVEVLFDSDFLIDAYTVHLDSTLSSNLNVVNHLVGIFDDQEIGKTIASNFSELVLPENEVDFGITTNTFNSVELHLLSNYYYGDKGECKILINKVTSSLDEKSEYYTFDNSTIGENIGSITINTSTDIGTELVFPLNNDFGNSIFNESPAIGLSTQEDFRTFLNGISLQPQSGNAIIAFEPTSSFVRINFTTDSSTEYKDFYLNDDGNHYNRVYTQSYNGLLSTLGADRSQVISTDANDLVYTQGSTKLNIRLNSSDLKTFLDQKNISIYRAEIEIKVDTDTTYPHPEALYLYSSNENNTQIENGFLATNGSSSDINYVLLEDDMYTFNITDYLQKIIVDVTELEDFMISVTPTANLVDRLIIKNPSDNIKIKIHYTEL